jgi:hypothetical protein
VQARSDLQLGSAHPEHAEARVWVSVVDLQAARKPAPSSFSVNRSNLTMVVPGDEAFL